MKNKLLVLTFLFLAACSSNNGIRIDSSPQGAEVDVIIPGQSPKKVGTTPLQLDEKKVGVTSQPIQIQVSQKGFDSRSLVLPPATFTRVGTLYFELPPQSLPAACSNPDAMISKATRAVAEAFAHIQSKRLDQAETVLLNISNEFPNISLYQDLLGNVYFLKRDFAKALKSYQKSATLNPSNSETNRMIQKLETMKSQGGL